MKEYFLKILFPSSANRSDQFYTVSVQAESVETEDGAYIFFESSDPIAYYPIQYTIIERIEEVDE